MTATGTEKAVLRIDRLGWILYANEAAARLTGHPVDRLRMMSLWDICHPDDVNQVQMRLNLLQPGHTGHFEYRAYAEDAPVRVRVVIGITGMGTYNAVLEPLP